MPEPEPPTVVYCDGIMVFYSTRHAPKTDMVALPRCMAVFQDTNRDGKPDQKVTIAIRHEDTNGNGLRDVDEPIYLAVAMVQAVGAGLIEMNDGMRLAAAQAVASAL